MACYWPVIVKLTGPSNLKLTTMRLIPNYSNTSTSQFDFRSNEETRKHSMDFPFEINTLEWTMEFGAFRNQSSRQVTRYGIIWIKKGSGQLRVDLSNYDIRDNMIVCFSPGQAIVIDSDEVLEGFFISFTSDFLLLSEAQVNASFLENLFDRSELAVIYLNTQMQNEYDDLVRRMNNESQSQGMLKALILKGLLRIFLIYLSRDIGDRIPKSMQDRDTEVVRKFTALVRKNFFSKKMVVDYARELCISPNYLNRVVKKISGFTASHHIQQHIILEAKRQAIYSGLSMKEVACLLGFSDYAHFSKFFKNNSGTNFTCFKKAVE